MAIGGYDGSIKIDSRIDSKGFNKGVSGMVAALKPLAFAIAATFGIRAIVSFGKTAVDEASKMASALIGLQSIVEGTGNSFSGAQKFIDEFIADGLVPAANAVTAYKNLLSRGYNTEQIEKSLIALKNSAAFGRQASLSIGQAVQSASEGLRNENSILVDNAGLTKNVSILWKEYAESIGTTVGALTKQQKILAEVQGIQNETRFQMGDAAKLAGTYAGQVSALGVSFRNLKVALGNAIIPLLQQIIPIIRTAIDAMTVFFNRLATIMSILFGVDMAANAAAMDAVAGSTEAAAEAQGELAENTAATGKAAKGALAAFDDLNVLQQDTGTGADEAGAITEPVTIPEPDVAPFDEGMEKLKAQIEEWKTKFLEFFAPLRSAIENDLLPVIERLGGTVWAGLVWVWENILKPLGAWIVEVLAPVLVKYFAASLDVINSALQALAPAFEWLWVNLLRPAAEWIGTVLVQVFEWLTERLKELKVWIDNNQEAFSAIVIVLGVILGAFILLATGGIALVIAIIAGLIIILANAGKAWVILVGVAREAWKTVTLLWGIAGEWFKLHVTDPIYNAFVSAFTGIKNFVKGILNSIIDFINGMISGVVDGINTIIAAANTVGGILPGYNPVDFVNAPQIPRLATGAVIPPNAAFLAVMGEQKSGRNIEAPEGLIRQILREEMGSIKSEIQIEFTGSLAALARELRPQIVKENTRIGGNLIKSGVTR